MKDLDLMQNAVLVIIPNLTSNNFKYCVSYAKNIIENDI